MASRGAEGAERNSPRGRGLGVAGNLHGEEVAERLPQKMPSRPPCRERTTVGKR